MEFWHRVKAVAQFTLELNCATSSERTRGWEFPRNHRARARQDRAKAVAQYTQACIVLRALSENP